MKGACYYNGVLKTYVRKEEKGRMMEANEWSKKQASIKNVCFV